MNRTLRLVGMAAMVLLLAASCKKEKQNEDGLVMKTFSAGIAQNGGAKTGLIPQGNANEGTHFFQQTWLSTDVINVNGQQFPIVASSITPVNPESPEGGCTAEFQGLVKPSDNYYAIYPYDGTNTKAVYNKSDHTATFVIPEVQTVTKTTAPDGVSTMYVPDFLPMAAKCSAGAEHLDFQNLCGLFELRLYCPTDLDLTVDKIAITTNTAGEFIAGTWIYDFNGTFNRDVNAGTNNRVVMSFGQSIEVSKNANVPTSFIFVLPPIEATSNFNVYIYGNETTNDFVTMTSVASGALSITAGGVLYNMEAIEILPQINVACNQVKNHSLDSNVPEGSLDCTGAMVHVNSNDGIVITERGFCVVPCAAVTSLGHMPDRFVNPEYYHATSNINGETFTSVISGLDANTQYYVVAYAVYNYKGNSGLKAVQSGAGQPVFPR